MARAGVKGLNEATTYYQFAILLFS